MAVVFTVAFFTLLLKDNSQPSIEQMRKTHQYFLENSPFRATRHLAKKERKAMELPPNAYNEMMWERTMNPTTGRPEPEKLLQIEDQIQQNRWSSRPEAQQDMIWTERGPANLGGRTRAILFDPNDIGNSNPNENYNRVFAGAVSGGLWVNEDITDPNSSWILVAGLSSNISITKIISDPNNPKTLYIASGESFTGGQAIGNGVWKSTDGGTTWRHIFGGYTGVEEQKHINGVFYINDIAARDLGDTTELFITVAGSYYSSSGTLSQFYSVKQQGVYKSSDNGSNWLKLDINESNGRPINPNDLEIDLNNNIWVTTNRNLWGQSGGKIYKSTNGLNFELMYGGEEGMGRTELEPSVKDPDTFWVLVSHRNQADFYVTTNGFQTLDKISTEPNDADPGITGDDFTRGQAFYDLEIEVNSNDDLFVGGIDLFRSNDKADSWIQLSHWYGGGGFQNVHADQHAIVFRPGSGNNNQAVFGNDGGVYYCNDLSKPKDQIKIEPRNKGYNTSQFYYGSIDKNPANNNDALAGGTQDNGTWTQYNAETGINPFHNTMGGDGAYTEIDAKDNYMIASYVFDEHIYYDYPDQEDNHPISMGSSKGSFINTAVLDKTLDVFYHDSSQGSNFSLTRSSNFKSGETNIIRTELTHAQFDNRPSALSISPHSKQVTTLYLGLVNGKLFRIDDASTTPRWSEITGSKFVGSISDVEVGTSENELFATLYNYGIDNIWHSKDAGKTWTSIEGNLPDLPVSCILQNPLTPKELIIGTPVGIWRTLDFTKDQPSWEPVSKGINRVPVVDLDFLKSDQTILAATHGRGLFTSKFESPKASIDDNEIDKVIVVPTVSDGNLKIVPKKDFGSSTFYVFAVTGQLIYKFDMELKKGDKKTINLQLSSGVYLLTIHTPGQNFTDKIIIR